MQVRILQGAPQKRYVDRSKIWMIGIKYSRPRRHFKEILGQVNHYVITLLVGLDAVEKGDAKLGDSFSTSWNPKSLHASARLSREFALKATLAWTVDAVDTYITDIHTFPKFVSGSDLENALSAAGRSVDRKTDALIEVLAAEDEISASLTKLAVVWRNRLVHYYADNPLRDEVREHLTEESETVEANYRGLDTGMMLKGFDKSHAPRFKEAASLVQAAHDFVSFCDGLLLKELDLSRLIDDFINYHLTENFETGRNKNPKSRAGKIWNRTTPDSKRTLVQILQNYGFTKSDNGLLTSVSDDYIEKIASLQPSEAISRFLS